MVQKALFYTQASQNYAKGPILPQSSADGSAHQHVDWIAVAVTSI